MCKIWRARSTFIPSMRRCPICRIRLHPCRPRASSRVRPSNPIWQVLLLPLLLLLLLLLLRTPGRACESWWIGGGSRSRGKEVPEAENVEDLILSLAYSKRNGRQSSPPAGCFYFCAARAGEVRRQGIREVDESPSAQQPAQTFAFGFLQPRFWTGTCRLTSEWPLARTPFLERILIFRAKLNCGKRSEINSPS